MKRTAKKSAKKAIVQPEVKKEGKSRRQVVKEMHDIYFEFYKAEGVIRTVIRSLQERVDIRDIRQPNLHEEVNTLEDALKRFAAAKTKFDAMSVDIYCMRIHDDE